MPYNLVVLSSIEQKGLRAQNMSTMQCRSFHQSISWKQRAHRQLVMLPRKYGSLSLTILKLAEPEHPLKCHASPTSVLLTTVSGEVSLQTERAESVKPISDCKCTAPQASKATTAWCSTVESGNCSLISLWKCARRTRTSAVMSILNHGLLMQYEVSLWHCCSGSYLDDTGCLRQLAHGLANTDMHKCTPPCI